MESLGLPDVRLALRDGMTEAEALAVLETACAALIDGSLMKQSELVMPGSGQRFQAVSAEDDWLELAAVTTQATS
jgi:predicted RNase H-like HicB family nuclease